MGNHHDRYLHQPDNLLAQVVNRDLAHAEERTDYQFVDVGIQLGGNGGNKQGQAGGKTGFDFRPSGEAESYLFLSPHDVKSHHAAQQRADSVQQGHVEVIIPMVDHHEYSYHEYQSGRDIDQCDVLHLLDSLEKPDRQEQFVDRQQIGKCIDPIVFLKERDYGNHYEIHSGTKQPEEEFAEIGGRNDARQLRRIVPMDGDLAGGGHVEAEIDEQRNIRHQRLPIEHHSIQFQSDHPDEVRVSQQGENNNEDLQNTQI